MTSFLARSFRRTLHAQQEGKIIKNVGAGQNLEVCANLSLHFLLSFKQLLSFQVIYQTWEDFREADAMIEEAAEVEDDDNDDTEEEVEPQSFDEKRTLAEEVAMHLSTTDLVVSGLNEERGVVEIGSGRRNANVDDDDLR